jgi:hypothetical protein
VASYTEQNDGKKGTPGKIMEKKKKTIVNLLKSQEEQNKERKLVYKEHNLKA